MFFSEVIRCKEIAADMVQVGSGISVVGLPSVPQIWARSRLCEKGGG